MSAGAGYLLCKVSSVNSKTQGSSLRRTLSTVLLLHTRTYAIKPACLLSHLGLHTQTAKHQSEGKKSDTVCDGLLFLARCTGLWHALVTPHPICPHPMLSFIAFTPCAMQQGLNQSEGALWPSLGMAAALNQAKEHPQRQAGVAPLCPVRPPGFIQPHRTMPPPLTWVAALLSALLRPLWMR